RSRSRADAIGSHTRADQGGTANCRLRHAVRSDVRPVDDRSIRRSGISHIEHAIESRVMRVTTRVLVCAMVVAFAGQTASAQQTGRRDPAPTLTTQDYIDIQQLIARYAVAIDECTNNGYDYAALYADDGWFSASR